jgi:hypothetical protein
LRNEPKVSRACFARRSTPQPAGTRANAYASTYAGLASAMVALVFLYWTAGIFVYGGALNQAIRKAGRSQHQA